MSTDPFPIAIITGDFVQSGGMDRANFALADFLASAGHTVHAVAHRVDPALLANEHVVFDHVKEFRGSDLMSAPFLDRAGRRIAAQVQRQGGRVIVNGGNCGWGDVNWVHYVHSVYRPTAATGLLGRIKSRIATDWHLRAERRNVPRAKLVIANSELTRRNLIENVGVSADRVKTVYYGADNRFVPPTPARRAEARRSMGWSDDRPKVMFVGALGDRRKGFDTAFEAWTHLCGRSEWDADLVVAGTGAELPVWKKRAVDAGLAHRFEFLGFRTDVPSILQGADALIAPTRYEAYGLGVQEALCCGLPAIVSAAAGVAERYPAELGDLLIDDPEDHATLETCLMKWRGSRERYADLALQLSARLRRHDWSAMGQQILRLLESSPD